MSTARDWEHLATALAHMARDLVAQESVQETLERIVTHAVTLVDGCDHAGVLVVRDRRVETLSATSDLVRTLDRLQGESGEGPCFDAVREGEEVYRITDLTDSIERWPEYAPKARELGVGSMMGFLLFTDEGRFGALDLYASQPAVFNESSEQVGWLLASHAAVALSSARKDAQLHEAIGTRQDIGEALGIIMERYKVPDDQAFRMLTRASQDRNVKLRNLARTITETGEVPGARE